MHNENISALESGGDQQHHHHTSQIGGNTSTTTNRQILTMGHTTIPATPMPPQLQLMPPMSSTTAIPATQPSATSAPAIPSTLLPPPLPPQTTHHHHQHNNNNNQPHITTMATGVSNICMNSSSSSISNSSGACGGNGALGNCNNNISNNNSNSSINGGIHNVMSNGGGNGGTGSITAAVSAAPNTLGTSGGIARECAGCGKCITERFLLKALDLFWHEDCLKCGCCDCRLGEVGSTLYTKANLILCKRDYLRLFGTTGYCAACNKVIPAFEMVMRAKSNVYHLECFACQQCNHRFCVGDRFYLCDNKILCEYDYEERLVFANMAYNPSSLAHIRRQVSNLQPAGDSNMNCIGNHHGNSINGRIAALSSTMTPRNHPAFLSDKLPMFNQQPNPPHHNNILAGGGMIGVAGAHHRTGDDGSSGYGSPDSETFEQPQSQ